MPKCIIITPLAPKNMISQIDFHPEDLILCADGGYDAAYAQGIKPHMVMGDFDSITSTLAADCPVVRVPSHKDETDTFLCMETGMEKGYTKFAIMGGLSGRLDHTVANLQLLAYGREKGLDLQIIQEDNEAFLLSPGTHLVPRREGWKLSVFSYTESVTGVSLHSVAYPLDNATLTHAFPLGVSNEFQGPHAVVSFHTGLLLVILSKA